MKWTSSSSLLGCKQRSNTSHFAAFLHGVGHRCAKSGSAPYFCVAELQLDWIGKSGYRSASEREKILTMASWI